MIAPECLAQTIIYVNQVGFDINFPKIAVIGTDHLLSPNASFEIIEESNNKLIYKKKLRSRTNNWWVEAR